MRITHSRNPKVFEYRIGNNILEDAKSHPYLGVDITNTGVTTGVGGGAL